MKKLLFFILTLFVAGYTVNSQVSHWKFENNANDETGANNGTLVNGGASLYVGGVSGKAIDFSAGTDSTYIEVADDASIDFDSTKSFTVSLFLKIDTLSGGRIFVKGSSGISEPAHPDWNGKRYEMYVGGDGSLRWVVDDNVTKSQLTVDNAASLITPGSWNHLVGVRDITGSMLYLYINGELAGELSDATTYNIQSPNVPLIIGRSEYKYGDGIPGVIDEFEIYNKALSPAEVTALYRYYVPVILSDNTTLLDLKVSGATIVGFDTSKTSYNVELPAGTTTAPAVMATAADSNATVQIAGTDTLPGTTTITVTAEDGTTIQNYTINFTVAAATGINNLVTHNNVSIYPVPVHNVLFIEHAGKFTELSIYNTIGTLIYSQHADGAPTQQIDVSALPNGVYIIKAKTDENDITSGTFLKQ